MATYTSYLNLEKPTTSETFNLLKMNQNWDKIDNGVSALNSSILQNSNTVEESTFDGTVFPSSKRARSNMQVVIVSRKIADGSLYILWYSGAQNGFRVGATLSGSAPVQGDVVVLSYPT